MKWNIDAVWMCVFGCIWNWWKKELKKEIEIEIITIVLFAEYIFVVLNIIS